MHYYDRKILQGRTDQASGRDFLFSKPSSVELKKSPSFFPPPLCYGQIVRAGWLRFSHAVIYSTSSPVQPSTLLHRLGSRHHRIYSHSERASRQQEKNSCGKRPLKVVIARSPCRPMSRGQLSVPEVGTYPQTPCD